MNSNKFETGATTAAVNDLILYSENTAGLAALRDYKYRLAEIDRLKPDTLAALFEQLFHAARSLYLKQVGDPDDDDDDADDAIRLMTAAQRKEYCQLYAEGLADWIEEKNLQQLPPRVIITLTVQGGVVQQIQGLTPDVTLVINDYDTDDDDAETDANGIPYTSSTYFVGPPASFSGPATTPAQNEVSAAKE